MTGRLGQSDSLLGSLALGQVDTTSPWTPSTDMDWGISEHVVALDTASVLIHPNARVSELVLEVAAVYAFEVQGIELIYQEPSPQLRGLELIYRERLPQLGGIELIYRERVPQLAGVELLFDPNDIDRPSLCFFFVKAVDLLSGDPLEGALVVVNTGARASTGSDGIATFVDLAPGEKHWYVTADGFTPTWGCSYWEGCDDGAVRTTELFPLTLTTPATGFCTRLAQTGDPSDDVPAPTLFELATDGDGIPAHTCCATCDETPTIEWSTDLRYDYPDAPPPLPVDDVEVG